MNQKRMNFSRAGSFFSEPDPIKHIPEPVDKERTEKAKEDDRPLWNVPGRSGYTFNEVKFTPPDPEKLALPGKYTVTNPKGLLVRGNARLLSAEKGMIANGQEIRVVDVRGRRARVAGTSGVVAGWISLRSATGTWLVERTADLSPSPGRVVFSGSPAPAPTAHSPPGPVAPPSAGESSPPQSPSPPPPAQKHEIYDSEGYFGHMPSPSLSPEPEAIQDSGAPPAEAAGELPPAPTSEEGDPGQPAGQPEEAPLSAEAGKFDEGGSYEDEY